MTFDQIWLLSRVLQSLRSGQVARQCLACTSAAKLVNSGVMRHSIQRSEPARMLTSWYDERKRLHRDVHLQFLL